MDFADLSNKLKELSKGPVQVMPVMVTAVDEDALTIDVEPLEGAPISNVRLRAAIDEVKDGFYLIPENNTSVLIGLIGNDEDTAFLVQCSKVKKVVFVAEDTKLGFDKDLFELIVGGDSKARLKCDKDGNIVMNGGNNDGVPKVGALVTKISNLETQVNNILTALKSISIVLAPSGTFPLATYFTSINSIAPLTQKSDLENEKVKH